MSKRFGRNQKRQYRARIAELEKRLRDETVFYMYMPHGGERDLEAEISVYRYYERLSGGAYDRVEREAEVEVSGLDSIRHRELWASGRPVIFRGHRYIIVDIDAEIDRDIYTIKLRGIS